MRRSPCLRPRIRVGSDSRGHRDGDVVVGGHLLGDSANQVGAVVGPGVVWRDDYRSLLETGDLQLLKGGGVLHQVHGFRRHTRLSELTLGGVAPRAMRSGEYGDGHGDSP